MKRRKSPLERMQIAEAETRTKVAAVLSVLAGERSIREVCDATGLKSLQYYKLEDRMVAAMIQAAKLPERGGKRQDPIAAANALAAKAEELRREERRLSSLVRLCRKLGRRTSARPPARSVRKPAGSRTPAQSVPPPGTEEPKSLAKE